jgi:hypothetical protein
MMLGALPRTGMGREPNDRGVAGGRGAPAGLSPLPVRPLRLSPMTATAGGRASVTPGTDPHQLAAVTPTGRRPLRTRVILPALQCEAGQDHAQERYRHQWTPADTHGQITTDP